MSKPSRLKRWLRRILAASLIASVALGWAIFHDEPQPDLSDFDLPLIEAPEQDNAYWLLFEAARLAPLPPIPSDSEYRSNRRAIWAPYLDDTADARERRFSEHREFWALLDAADTATHAIAPINIESGYPSPETGELRPAWALLLARALHAAESGDIPAAFADADQALRLARRFESSQSDIIHLIISQALINQSLRAVRSIADHCTEEDTLKAMIDTLDSRRGSTEHIIRSFKSEARARLATLESRESLHRFAQSAPRLPATAPTKLPAPLALPLYNPRQSQRIYAEYVRELIDLLQQPESEFVPRYDELTNEFSIQLYGNFVTRFRNLQGRMVLAPLAPLLGTVAKSRLSTETQLDLTRLYLALRLYSLRHDRLPDQLDDLAPECIATIPLDRFAAAPFSYSPSEFQLWSSGMRKSPTHLSHGSRPDDPLLMRLHFVSDEQDEN